MMCIGNAPERNAGTQELVKMEEIIRIEKNIEVVPAGIYIGKLEKIEDYILKAKEKGKPDEDMYKLFWTVDVNGKRQVISELCNKRATSANKLGKTIKALLRKDVQPGDEVRLSSLIGFTCSLVVEEVVKENGYKGNKIPNRVPLSSGMEMATV